MNKLNFFKKIIFLLSITFLCDSALAKSAKKLITDIPNNYEKLSACEKQSILWQKIEDSKHDVLPSYAEMNFMKLVGMGFQKMRRKVNHSYDVAPKNWKKYLHKRGAVAKVKIRPTAKSANSGVFSGAECALVRLSLTYKPTKKRAVAPGLALKVLRDGVRSANVSALYSLEGQGSDYNFFTYPLSNIVPIGTDVGLKLVHSIFERVTDYPEQLGVKDMFTLDTKGKKSNNPNVVKQIFFVPGPGLKEMFSSNKHDVREDFLKLEKGVVLYQIYSVDQKHMGFNYYDYSMNKMKEFLKDSKVIGEVVLTSPFLASEFGDTQIFFRHETVD